MVSNGEEKEEVPRFSLEFKAETVGRVLGGEPLRSVCRDLKLHHTVLMYWMERHRRQGAKWLRGPDRPSGEGVEPSEAERSARRIAELERKVGQQAIDLDFLRRAFERVKELRQSSTAPGVTASTK